MKGVTLDQVCAVLERQDRYRERVQTLRRLRNGLLNYSNPPWVIRDEVPADFPGCRLQVIFPATTEDESLIIPIVAWNDSCCRLRDGEPNWLEVAVGVGSHLREPTHCALSDVLACVESLARSLGTLLY
jgi:hypothetical protein